MLLAHSLGLKRLDLYLQFDRELAEAELAPYRELTARRARGEPVAYLTGHKEFMALDFLVTGDVLVPNPDTEVLVQRAVEWGREQDRPLRLADVGTGCGCIAVAVAHYLPSATIDAVDLSPAALEVAQLNAHKHGVVGRIRFLEGDLAAPLDGRYDAVLANLPYLRQGAALAREVLAQPPIALFGGPELVNRLLAELPRLLTSGGIALLEIDPAIAGELKLGGLAGTRVHKDLGGHDRVLEAWI